jgi:hypothetical protein
MNVLHELSSPNCMQVFAIYCSTSCYLLLPRHFCYSPNNSFGMRSGKVEPVMCQTRDRANQRKLTQTRRRDFLFATLHVCVFELRRQSAFLDFDWRLLGFMLGTRSFNRYREAWYSRKLLFWTSLKSERWYLFWLFERSFLACVYFHNGLLTRLCYDRQRVTRSCHNWVICREPVLVCTAASQRDVIRSVTLFVLILKLR